MRNRRLLLALGASVAALFLMGGEARAATIVVSDGLAGECSQSAKAGASDEDALQTCSYALEREPLTTLDRARTLVNRSVILINRKSVTAAAKDIDAAEKIAPGLPEIYVNRGIVYFAQGKYADAVTEITKGINLGPEFVERAYFNRALAYDFQNDLRMAYFDYRKASELKPDWEAPKTQLARFSVSRQ